MNEKLDRIIFAIAGIYDGLLGLAFFVLPASIFLYYGVEPPNHLAYVQFPALLLLIFAAMFFRVARDPYNNRVIMLYGCGLKLSYCALAFWYLLNGGIPSMWVPWAWIDLLFLLLFLAAWVSTGKLPKSV